MSGRGATAALSLISSQTGAGQPQQGLLNGLWEHTGHLRLDAVLHKENLSTNLQRTTTGCLSIDFGSGSGAGS
jgi:hypothetical protein